MLLGIDISQVCGWGIFFFQNQAHTVQEAETDLTGDEGLCPVDCESEKGKTAVKPL